MSKPLIFVVQVIAAIFVFAGILAMMDKGSPAALIIGVVLFIVARYGWKKRVG